MVAVDNVDVVAIGWIALVVGLVAGFLSAIYWMWSK
jgi:hypothetical protein